MKFPEITKGIKAVATKFEITEEEVEKDLLLTLRAILDTTPDRVTKKGIDVLRRNKLLSNKELLKWFFIFYHHEIYMSVATLIFIAQMILILWCILH